MTARRISVIIPALTASPSLVALTEQLRCADIFEVLIVSPRKPLNLLTNKVKCLAAKAGRGPQIQAGLKAAQGNIIWILHSDSQIPHGAVASLRAILTRPNVSFGCFQLGFDKSEFWLRLFAWMSRFESAVSTFGDQGFFFNRDLVSRLPDLEDYPLMEDVVMRRELLRLGGAIKSPLVIKTSSARFDRLGPLRTQAENAVFLLKFWCGVSPRKLYEQYYGKPANIATSTRSLTPLPSSVKNPALQ